MAGGKRIRGKEEKGRLAGRGKEGPGCLRVGRAGTLQKHSVSQALYSSDCFLKGLDLWKGEVITPCISQQEFNETLPRPGPRELIRHFPASAGQGTTCLTVGFSSHQCPFYLGPAPQRMGLTLSVVCLKQSWSHTGPRAHPTAAWPPWRPWPHLAQPRAPSSPLRCLLNPQLPGLTHPHLPRLPLLNRILVPALLLMVLGSREGRQKSQMLGPRWPQGRSFLAPPTLKIALGWG